jgi:hypothetical protein
MRHRAGGARPWPLKLEAARGSTKNLSASTVRLVLSGWYVTVRASTRPENSPARGRGACGRTRRCRHEFARAARRLAVAVAPARPRVRQSDSGSPHRAACARARRSTDSELWSDAPHPSRQGHWHWPRHPAPRARGASMLAALPRCALGLRTSLPASVHGRASRPRGGREGRPRDGVGSARPHRLPVPDCPPGT